MLQKPKPVSKWGDTRFIHIYDTRLKRRVTAAFKYDDEEQKIFISVAQCSRRDTYCKRIGRTVSHGRLQTGHYLTTIDYKQLTDGLGYKAVTQAVAETAVHSLQDS